MLTFESNESGPETNAAEGACLKTSRIFSRNVEVVVNDATQASFENMGGDWRRRKNVHTHTHTHARRSCSAKQASFENTGGTIFCH